MQTLYQIPFPNFLTSSPLPSNGCMFTWTINSLAFNGFLHSNVVFLDNHTLSPVKMSLSTDHNDPKHVEYHNWLLHIQDQQLHEELLEIVSIFSNILQFI